MSLIAIAFADLHLHKFKAFDQNNSRLEWSLKAFKRIATVAKMHNVPLLFAGDLFHTPMMVDNYVLTRSMEVYDEYVESKNIRFIAISGNHDLSEKNGTSHKAPSYLRAFKAVFSSFNLLDYYNFGYRSGGIMVHGIPYMNNDHELHKQIKKYKKLVQNEKSKATKILLMHGDCPGAVETNGITLGETKAIPTHVDDFFSPWDWVLFGHIHHPQKISSRVTMLGSPIHQTSGDKGPMGYWKIFSDKRPQFYGLVGYPKFIKLEAGQEPYNDLDYFIPYEELGKIEELEQGDFDLSLDRAKLAKRYLKKKGITDKIKKRALINALNAEE